MGSLVTARLVIVSKQVVLLLPYIIILNQDH